MNHHASIPLSGGDQAEMLKDKLTPKAIVTALNEHIVGQDDAKKAVAVALRNRWRRQQLSPELRDEVTPKNILMRAPPVAARPRSAGASRSLPTRRS